MADGSRITHGKRKVNDTYNANLVSKMSKNTRPKPKIITTEMLDNEYLKIRDKSQHIEQSLFNQMKNRPIFQAKQNKGNDSATAPPPDGWITPKNTIKSTTPTQRVETSTSNQFNALTTDIENDMEFDHDPTGGDTQLSTNNQNTEVTAPKQQETTTQTTNTPTTEKSARPPPIIINGATIKEVIELFTSNKIGKTDFQLRQIQLEIKANIENHWEKICKKVNHRDHTKFFPIINKVFRPRERSHMPNLSIKEENSHLIDRCDIKKDDLNKTNNEYIIEEVADKINIIGAFYETINSPKYLNANTRTKEVADRTVQELEQRLARDTEENKTITVFSQENRAYAPNNNDDNYFCTGTVNSPTLFNIFTSHTLNAFKLNQDNNTYSIAYADDLILYVAAKYPEPLKVQLERLVNKLNNYYAL
ncbi:hypothetical protein KQX54_015507 [Cotesia glomerata]|uniref:Reverse transcriptase domain-containing protein n=1 Tax=Cotesia glomerata TaxID=32391 RepID=A0AAV7IE08_COTGL|nr:hypothetical protein KQX54_015507 [Cotesia glomerata]